MEESSYERSALVLDGDDHRLAQASASLAVLGHRMLYSDDLDEMIRHAAEYREQMGALLLPAAHAMDWWPTVRKWVVEPIGIAPRSVLPVGESIAASDAESLHSDGLRWMLREPFSPQELRFAVSKVLAEADPDELRIETRVPCSIPVEVESPHRTVTAHLTDHSTSGAFVQLAHPQREGARLVVRAELCGRSVSLNARVAWRGGPRSPSWLDRGMGVVFERLEIETIDLLLRQTDRVLDRFRLLPHAT